MPPARELVTHPGWCREIIDLGIDKVQAYDHNRHLAERTLEVKLVPFKSLLRRSMPAGTFKGDVQFYLRFYLPKPSGAKYKKLFVLINGLGEGGPGIHDDLALELAKKGIPSVLFPLPRHFHRHPEFNCSDDLHQSVTPDESKAAAQVITAEVAQDPTRIVDAYLQAVFDVAHFISQLPKLPRPGQKPPPPYSGNVVLRDFLHERWEDDPVLHFLGYSLGGLVALGMKLIYDDIHSAFLIESGASFEQINAGVLFERDAGMVNAVWKKRILPHLRAGGNLAAVGHLLIHRDDHWFNRELFHVIKKQVDEDLTAVKVIEQDEEYLGKAYAFHLADLRRKNDDRLLADDLPRTAFFRSKQHGERIWNSFVRKLAVTHQNAPLWDQIFATAHQVFQWIVLGNDRIGFKDRLKANSERILIILGGSDALFQWEAIQSFSPKDTGLAIVQIPGLGHWLKFSSKKKWHVWLTFISTAIRAFTEVESEKHVPLEAALD